MNDTIVPVRAVSRAMAVLRCFSAARPHLPLGEIAATAGLDKATTRRLLLTLMSDGWVRQDGAGQLYCLSTAVLSLAAAVPTGGLREQARPVMRRLAASVGATVFLSVVDGDAALCLERIHADNPVRLQWWEVGSRRAFNLGAGPRLLLAFLPLEMVEQALRTPVTATPFTETDLPRLRRHLALVRARGWEATIDDVTVGLSAVAVPIRDSAGRVVAALSLGGLTPALLDNGQPLNMPTIQAAAAEISSALYL